MPSELFSAPTLINSDGLGTRLDVVLLHTSVHVASHSMSAAALPCTASLWLHLALSSVCVFTCSVCSAYSCVVNGEGTMGVRLCCYIGVLFNGCLALNVYKF